MPHTGSTAVSRPPGARIGKEWCTSIDINSTRWNYLVAPLSWARADGTGNHNRCQNRTFPISTASAGGHEPLLSDIAHYNRLRLRVAISAPPRTGGANSSESRPGHA